jgi:predicted acyltransferase
MNRFPREKPYLFSGGGYCTLSFIPTLATMLLGLIAGRLLQLNMSVGRRQLWLWAAAIGCIGLALVVDAAGLCPIVKRIWTPTWALYSGGLCFVWLALLNAICDIAGYKNWGFPFVVIGANSIAAYVMSWTIKDQISLAITRHFGYFVDTGSVFLAERFGLGDSGAIKGLMIGVLTLSIMWMILLWMYRKRIFLKI